MHGEFFDYLRSWTEPLWILDYLLEVTTATAMANNEVTHDYTRQLLRSNAGFDRSSVSSGELDVAAG